MFMEVEKAPGTKKNVMVRDLDLSDVPALLEIANHKEVGQSMISLPIPFLKSDALALINEKSDRNIIKGVYEISSEKLIGVFKLRDYEREHGLIELSFWVNPLWWGKGYGSQAGFLMLNIAFSTPGINRVFAYHMVKNERSGKLLQRIGMTHEGVLRERVKKDNVFEDVVISAILKREWLANKEALYNANF